MQGRPGTKIVSGRDHSHSTQGRHRCFLSSGQLPVGPRSTITFGPSKYYLTALLPLLPQRPCPRSLRRLPPHGTWEVIPPRLDDRNTRRTLIPAPVTRCKKPPVQAVAISATTLPLPLPHSHQRRPQRLRGLLSAVCVSNRARNPPCQGRPANLPRVPRVPRALTVESIDRSLR